MSNIECSEDIAYEQKRLSDTADQRFNGDVLLAVAEALDIWGETAPKRGSYSHMCLAMAKALKDRAGYRADLLKDPAWLKEAGLMPENDVFIKSIYDEWEAGNIQVNKMAPESSIVEVLRLFKLIELHLNTIKGG